MSSNSRLGLRPAWRIRRNAFDLALLEPNDASAVQRARYMTLEATAPLSDDPIVRLSGCEALLGR
jgi:hypothetical protein